MKKLLILILIVGLHFTKVYSQATCAGAAPFCTASGTTFPASTSTVAPVGPNYGCLGSQPNPAWYYLQISAAGNININLSNSAGVDIDFCSWGPFATQAAMCPGTSGSPFDCSYSTSATEQVNIVGAVVGQWYMVLITNFSGVATNISATTAPGTTGATNCAILCNMTGLTAVPGPCVPATSTFTVNGTITTTTPPSTGTLTITSSCGGAPIVMSPPFATSIAYSFPGIPAGAGTCTITATYSADPTCTLTTTYTRPAPCSGCTATASNTGPYCAGATIQLNATGGGTYSWAGPGAFSSTLQNPTRPGSTTAMSGTYTVTVTSGAVTCTAITTVTVNALPTVTAEANQTYCAGAAVPINTFASTPAGATYTWTNSNTAIGLAASGVTSTPAFTAINATGATITSTITITPTLTGCTGPTSTYTITVNPIPVTTVNSVTICAGASATLTGAGATTYSWSTGAIANPITVTPAITTSYTVTGTTSTCTSSAIATVTVNPLPTVTAEANQTYCAGAPVPINTFASTPAGATYTWTNSNTTIGLTASGVTSTPAFTATNATGAAITSTITITPTLAGCTGPTSTYTITVNPLPVTSVNSPAICPGGTTTLTSAGATTYAWSTGAVTNSITVSPVVTTSYTVTGTTSGCTSSALSTVTVGAGITVNAGLTDTVCFGGSAILGVTPNGAGYTYSWTPTASLAGATTATPTASPTTTTTYTVLVSDPSGCTGTSTVTINADPQITLSIAGIDVTCNGACNGQTIVIPAGGTGAYAYNWSSGCSAASCTSLCPGTYTVTVTDSWGCTASGTAPVTQPALLTGSIPASTPTTCNAACDGAATAAGAGGTVGAGYSYSWNTVPVQATATATGLCAGAYTCTITDANGCTATTSATITQPTVVVIAPIATAGICFGGSTVITASASGGNGTPYAYTWSPATGLSATNIANPTASPAGTTVYTVNATDVNGCAAAPVNVTVTVNPPLTVAAAGSASICSGASTVITSVAANGTGGPYTYAWTPATGLSNAAITNPTASPSATTIYTVTASDGCSPTATATVTVTVLPSPVVAFSSPTTTGCTPLCVTFADNSTVAGGAVATWAWNFGDGNTSVAPAPTNCYTIPGSYNVTLTVTSTLGACTSTSTVNNFVTVYPNPVADFTTPVSASVLNPTVSYTDNSTIASGAITAWNWNFGDPYATGIDSTSALQNPSHTFTEAGTFCATLTVTSNFGCIDQTNLCVIIDPEFTFFIPNAFSPNGDGVNDEFYGKGDNIKKFEMFIYDRWGNLIFYSDDINKHWDGKANHGSEMAQQDVYVYSVRLTDHKDKKHKYTGTVTIVK